MIRGIAMIPASFSLVRGFRFDGATAAGFSIWTVLLYIHHNIRAAPLGNTSLGNAS